MSHLDLKLIRSYFPGFHHPANSNIIFGENAGGSLVNRFVLDKHQHYMANCRVQPYNGYGPSEEAGEAMDESYRRLAELHGVSSQEIMFGPSTSMNSYIFAQALAQSLNPKDEIVVTNQDHEANNGAWRRLAERGFTVREWAVDPEYGLLNTDDLRPLLNENTKIVCFPHCSNLTGAKNDVGAICDIVHQAGAKAIVDGVAWTPHQAPNFKALGADAYMYSMYKTYGPHLGLLYVDLTWLEGLANQGHFFNTHKASYRLTPAGPHHNDIACASGVVDYYEAVADAHNITGNDLNAKTAQLFERFALQEEALSEVLLAGLHSIDSVKVFGPQGSSRHERAPTIGFCSSKTPSSTIAAQLHQRGIGVSSGHFYAYRLAQALNRTPEEAVVRISFLHYNSLEEAETVVNAITDILA